MAAAVIGWVLFLLTAGLAGYYRREARKQRRYSNILVGEALGRPSTPPVRRAVAQMFGRTGYVIGQRKEVLDKIRSGVVKKQPNQRVWRTPGEVWDVIDREGLGNFFSCFEVEFDSSFLRATYTDDDGVNRLALSAKIVSERGRSDEAFTIRHYLNKSNSIPAGVSVWPTFAEAQAAVDETFSNRVVRIVLSVPYEAAVMSEEGRPDRLVVCDAQLADATEVE